MAMFGAAGPTDPGMSIPDDNPLIRSAANAPTRPSGMFAPGGVGRNIAGAIGDMLMARAGGQPMFMPMMQQQRQMQIQRSQMQAQQEAEYQRQLMLKQYELSNPAPTEFERELMAAGIQQGSPEWSQHMNAYVTMRENPITVQNVPGMGLVGVPRTPSAPLSDDDIIRMQGGQAGAGSPGGFRP